jgi:hypothetical protein
MYVVVSSRISDCPKTTNRDHFDRCCCRPHDFRFRRYFHLENLMILEMNYHGLSHPIGLSLIESFLNLSLNL